MQPHRSLPSAPSAFTTAATAVTHTSIRRGSTRLTLPKQPRQIAQPTTSYILLLPALLLRKCHSHQLPLVALDTQHSFLNTVLDNKTEHSSLALLAEAMHAVHSLVFNSRRPTSYPP